MLKKIKFKKSGQSILEVVISLGILGIILGGVIILLINISNYGSSAEARSLAVNYAQEAIDAIKNIRDNEYCCFFENNKNGYYELEKSGDNWLLVYLGNSSSKSWKDIFSQNSKEQLATNMQRQIKFSDISGINRNDGRRITVIIRWQTKGSPQQEYITSTEIYKWKY